MIVVNYVPVPLPLDFSIIDHNSISTGDFSIIDHNFGILKCSPRGNRNIVAFDKKTKPDAPNYEVTMFKEKPMNMTVKGNAKGTNCPLYFLSRLWCLFFDKNGLFFRKNSWY